MQEIRNLLEKHGYTLKKDYLHQDSDIEKYNLLPDRVTADKYYTIFSPRGFVVGRLFQNKSSNGTINQENLEKLRTLFSIYDIEDSEIILSELNELSAK